MKFTAFILLMATPEWLAEPRASRRAIAGNALAHAFPDQTVTFRFYDSEAFSGRVSDVAVVEADTPQAYYFAIERLRDSVLFTKPYYRIVEIIPAYENGFQEFENAL